MNITALARADIRNLRGYENASSLDCRVRLNANESPLATGTNTRNGFNRYPAPRPEALTLAMAELYGVPPENLLVTRGSSEGIDLIIRTFCAAGQDNVLITPPAFEMYQIYARIQGAAIVTAPLRVESDFAVDTDSLLDTCNDRTKLLFLSSPNNPVGNVIPKNDILKILAARDAQSVLVLDEAYIEFSNAESLVSLVAEHDNLVVLRTLSKAQALAGARCGAVIASTSVIQLLDRVLAPYALSSPAIETAELALSDQQLSLSGRAIRQTIEERERLLQELSACKAVRQIWPSQANFLFVRFNYLDGVKRCLDEAGISIRIYANDPQLNECARVTVGLEQDDNCLITALRNLD